MQYLTYIVTTHTHTEMLQSFSRAQGSGKRAKKDHLHRIYLSSTNLPKTTLLAIALVHSAPEKTFNCKVLLIFLWI